MRRLVLVLAACGSPPDPAPSNAAHAAPDPLLAALRSDTIQVATMRPPGSQFAILERRVILIGPPEAKQLAARGDVKLLDELLPLLDDPTRAWAAEVLLAKLTQLDEKTVDIYMSDPAGWWKTLGPTARVAWERRLAEYRGRFVWDPETGTFRIPHPTGS